MTLPTEPEASGLEPREDDRDGLPKRFARNAAMNYAASAGNALYTVVVIPIIVRGLGKTLFGIWSLATNLTSYLELFELGFGAATTKKVAEDADHRPDRVVKTINTSFFVLSLFGCIALFVGIGFAFAAPSWFDVPDGRTAETILTVLALSVGLSASIPGDAFGGALAGHQRFDLLSGSNLLLIVLQSIASVAVIFMGGGIVELAFVTVAIGMSMHLLRFSYLRGLVPNLRLTPHLIERSEIRSFGTTSWWFLVAQLSGTAVLRIDTVVVGVMLGVREAAVYAVGSKLAFFALRASRDLSTLFMPHATSLYHRGEHDRVGSVLIDGTRVSMLTTIPVALILTFLAGETLRVWVGRGYNGGAVVLAILAGTVAFRSLIEPTLAVLTAVGRVKTVALSVLAEAIVNVVLSILLARTIGLAGVAYGTLIGAVVIAAPLWVYALRVVGVGASRLWNEAILPHAPPTAVSLVVVGAFKFATPTGFIWLALAAGSALVAYGVVYARFGATPAELARARSAFEKLRARARRP